jgi:thiamine biosynthesis protein ThiI
LAKEYGTYDISILPDQDCCSLFLPKSPAIKAKKQFIEAEEESLAVDNLIQDAIDSIDIIKILA